MIRIGFVGGGTGGHFYPLIAVAEALQEQSEPAKRYYFGPNAYNADELKRTNITFIYCPAGKVRRYLSPLNILDFFKNLFGIACAICKLYRIYPDVIFSKGGYTSVPILIAARLLRIPVVIHESDSRPGRANRLAASFARYIAISYDEVAEFFPPEKIALTGIPIRQELIQPLATPHTVLGIPNDAPLIYVTGGSLGADRINNLILNSLDELLPRYRIMHQVGPVHLESMRQSARNLLADSTLAQRYYIVDTLTGEQVNAAMSAAALIITRAGSTTLFEIALHGKPAIVIPIPEAVSHDQRSNAYAYARSGAASVLEENNLTEHLLEAEIQSILGDNQRYTAMCTAARNFTTSNAAPLIAKKLIEIGIEHGSHEFKS